MTETELIEKCRRGERDAQRELYERHVPQIHRLMLRMAGNREDAFDLTQQTFVRAFERISSFDGRAGLGTWLYRIAANEALQLFRRRRGERKHLRVLAEERFTSGAAGTASHGVDLEAALARLSDEGRAILLLRYQESLSYDRIAAVLDCAPGTVASRLNRARAQLRALLEEADDSREEPSLHEHPND